MSLIETISPEQATGVVADVYRQMEKVLGRVPNGMRIYSQSPALLAHHWGELGYFIGHATLSPALLTTIRLLVSQANHCEYCVDMNAGMLIGLFGLTPEQVAAIRRDPQAAPFEAKDKALLAFVLETIVEQKPATPAGIEALKALGWSEADMFEAVLHGARNVAVDLVLNTFAVENDL